MIMQIPVGKTLDVELVEQQLVKLWQETSEAREDNDAAVLRARVANLLVYVSHEGTLANSHEILTELTAIHPSRVLTMGALLDAPDQDIEMTVETVCQTDKRSGAKRLSCEEITLRAQGQFVSELPSAALPLLVPDLPTFLWWRCALDATDKVCDALLQATDRLVLDSAEFADPNRDLIETNKIFAAARYDHVGISDLNWARLTFWRGLLADFYDVATYRALLDNVDLVQVDYVAPESPELSATLAPQALLIVGWLASRLGWTLAQEQPANSGEQKFVVDFASSAGAPVRVELNRLERQERKPGRLVRVELRSNAPEAASFKVIRSDDNLHILAEAMLGEVTQRGRVLPVRNRSAAQLLGREMEILCNDDIYQQAVAVAAKMIIGSTADS
jgi:glucose-6-phosphate dehydrogenase assembly protein OpcA